MELVQAMRNISVSGRVGLLFSVSMIAMLAALAACDDSAPANSTKVRPGAERQIGASNALPAGCSHARRHTEPAKLNSLVRGELDWIVMKALEKTRSRRYETVNGLAADLVAADKGEIGLNATDVQEKLPHAYRWLLSRTDNL